VGFWRRRMAQETVIHRLDAELAAQTATGRAVSPVPDDIAADGVDEVLVRFLGYGSTAWPDEFAALQGPRLERADRDDTVLVELAGASWTVRPRPDHVDVQAGAGGDVHAVVAGEPVPLLLWLWGRGGEEKISVSGDPAWADYLRRLLVATTQRLISGRHGPRVAGEPKAHATAGPTFAAGTRRRWSAPRPVREAANRRRAGGW
jgi:hypothetical protein